MSRILSLQTGKVQTFNAPPGSQEKPWTTATYKNVAEGPLWLGKEGFAGDGQADRKHHGGPDKAALVYSAEHYPLWQQEKVLPAPLPPGAFGENILVAEMVEAGVCIGDTYAVGPAVVQVTQPRQPCWKQARRWGVHDLVVRMIRTGRYGWYLRVLEEGNVSAGDHFVLRERPYPQWTIPNAYRVLLDKNDTAGAAELAACPALSTSWQTELRARLT